MAYNLFPSLAKKSIHNLLYCLMLLSVSCNDNSTENKTKSDVKKSNSIIAIINPLSGSQMVFKNGSLALLSFISPACEHCQYQTQALLSDHDKKPADLRLAFLSDVHPDSLKAFANQFEYDTTTTVFLWDEGGEMSQQMGVASYPTMFLYDTAGVHLQTIVGEAKPSYVYKFYHETH